MAQLTIILDKRTPNKAGELPIKFYLSNGTGKATTISTGIYVQPKHFTGNPSAVLVKNASASKDINTFVLSLYTNYYNRLLQAEREGLTQTYTLKELRDYITGAQDKTKPASFSLALQKMIDQTTNRSTKKICNYSYKCIHEFVGKDDVLFQDITVAFLQAFERWLINTKHARTNTRFIILSRIRTVFNQAIDEERIPSTMYPFRKFKFKIAQKEKEYLDLPDLIKLRDLPLQGNKEIARDLFMLSFYLCGANPVDLFYMLPAKNGVVTFVRTKIASKDPFPIHIRLQPEALAIVEKYKGKEHLLCFAEQKKPYTNFKMYISQCLVYIGKSLGWERCYFYLARYSWATYASKLDIPVSTIGKALGHTDATLAERTYISFDWEKVNQANRAVLDYVQAGV